jgi:glucose-1-phosphate thymidylyltransferase
LILDEKLLNSEIRGKVEESVRIQGRVRIEAGASVQEGSTIRGPAHVGSETIIEKGTYIGPYTSIGRRCRISSCELENSIVMDGCKISARQRITDSIIGSETVIVEHEKDLPKACHFVLGERSQLQL